MLMASEFNLCAIVLYNFLKRDEIKESLGVTLLTLDHIIFYKLQ